MHPTGNIYHITTHKAGKRFLSFLRGFFRRPSRRDQNFAMLFLIQHIVWAGSCWQLSRLRPKGGCPHSIFSQPRLCVTMALTCCPHFTWRKSNIGTCLLYFHIQSQPWNNNDNNTPLLMLQTNLLSSCPPPSSKNICLHYKCLPPILATLHYPWLLHLKKYTIIFILR